MIYAEILRFAYFIAKRTCVHVAECVQNNLGNT